MGKWMRNSILILCFNEDEVVGIVEKGSGHDYTKYILVG